MHLTYGPDLDSRGWPHVLASVPAVLGHLVAGPTRLLEQLELHLGLPGRSCPHGLRVALYAERLAATDHEGRFYHRSLQSDRWGTARTVLAWRDELVTAGWVPGLAEGRRLRDLAEVEMVEAPALMPGTAERWREVLGALGLSSLPLGLGPQALGPDSQALGPDSQALGLGSRAPGQASTMERGGQPGEQASPGQGDLVDAVLARLGEVAPQFAAEIRMVSPNCEIRMVSPNWDGGRLQGALAEAGGEPARLEGDGSVFVLRASDPWKAGEALGAFLAANPPDARQTLVVRGGAADVLDDALERHGLPPLGSSRRSPWRPATQVLPLAFALAWRPLDPYALLEMLTLAVSPLPGSAASALAQALRECPGVGGETWVQAWEGAMARAGERARAEALAADGDEANAEKAAAAESQRVRERLERWLGDDRVAMHCPAEGMPLQAAREIASSAASWAHGQLEALDEACEDERAVLAAARNQAMELDRILEVWKQPRLPRAQVEQILAQVRGSGTAAFSTAGRVGRMQFVDAPGAVHGPVDTVIWWHFVAPDDAAPPRSPWTESERQALAAAGVVLPDPAEGLLDAARRWRQPLLWARKRIILVVPEAAAGEPLRAHPLMDEIRSRACRSAADEARVTRTVEQVLRGELFPGDHPPAVEKVPSRPVPPPSAQWTLPESSLPARAVESSSSIECLLGCPLQWVLRYAAAIAPGALAGLVDGHRLAGILAHAIFQEILRPHEPLPEGDEARQQALRLFEERLASQAAPLLLPSRVEQRAVVATTIAQGAQALLDALRVAGLCVEGTEVMCEAPFEGTVLRGYIDLLLRRPDGSPAVVDLKYSGATYRRQQLENGTALQLATYAQVVRPQGDGTPPVAYFVIREAEMLTPDPQAFPTATPVKGPGMDATWQRALATRATVRADLEQGVVKVAAWDEPAQDESAMRLEAPCSFCDYGVLCGQRGAQ